jgi:hypothetical protein
MGSDMADGRRRRLDDLDPPLRKKIARWWLIGMTALAVLSLATSTLLLYNYRQASLTADRRLCSEIERLKESARASLLDVAPVGAKRDKALARFAPVRCNQSKGE